MRVFTYDSTEQKGTVYYRVVLDALNCVRGKATPPPITVKVKRGNVISVAKTPNPGIFPELNKPGLTPISITRFTPLDLVLSAEFKASLREEVDDMLRRLLTSSKKSREENLTAICPITGREIVLSGKAIEQWLTLLLLEEDKAVVPTDDLVGQDAMYVLNLIRNHFPDYEDLIRKKYVAPLFENLDLE